MRCSAGKDTEFEPQKPPGGRRDLAPQAVFSPATCAVVVRICAHVSVRIHIHIKDVKQSNPFSDFFDPKFLIVKTPTVYHIFKVYVEHVCIVPSRAQEPFQFAKLRVDPRWQPGFLSVLAANLLLSCLNLTRYFVHSCIC